MNRLNCALVTGCTSSKWDTSDVDLPADTSPPTFGRDEAGVIASISYHLSTVSDDLNQWAAPKDQADCAATRIVRRISADRLLSLGYEPDAGNLGRPYEPEEETALVNILTSCIDFEQGLLAVISSYDKLSISASACFSRGMRRLGLVRDLARGILSGQQPDPFAGTGRLSKGMGQLMAECLTTQDLVVKPNSDVFPADRREALEADSGSTTTEPETTTTVPVGPGA